MQSNFLMLILMTVMLSGCAGLQTVSSIDSSSIHTVCIVENAEIKYPQSLFVDIFKKHNIQTVLIPGIYEVKHSLEINNSEWSATYSKEDASSCDSIFFYSGTWRTVNPTSTGGMYSGIYFGSFGSKDKELEFAYATVWMEVVDEKRTRLGSATWKMGELDIISLISPTKKFIELTNLLINKNQIERKAKELKGSEPGTAVTGSASTKQPPAKAGGFELRTESPDTRRLNDAS